jgi:hypothetical protein
MPHLFDELPYLPEENHSKVYTSTWTMYVRILQGDAVNVFTQRRSSEYRASLQPGPRTK